MSDQEPQPAPVRLRPFDRRLLARAVDVRWVLVVDVLAGLLSAVLLLLLATLLAGVVAHAMGQGGRSLSGQLVVILLGIVVLRAGLAHAVEWSGRRAANRVMGGLRMELVERSLGHDRPEVADVGELATIAVQGVDGLETYFARYLPQIVLAVLVPVSVLAWCAAVDVTSALIMVLTVPVIPIFMALIGRSAAGRARANWSAMSTLASHFLDIVRGLGTLRALNRGRAQVATLAASTEAYRLATMSTLRLAFLSGVVLDLAMTLSIALVAVTLGVRLVGGSVGLAPALTVLLLVPEFFAPIKQVGTLFHASADGLAGAERILGLLGPAAATEPVARAREQAEVNPFAVARPVRIELRDVTVEFRGRPNPALSRVDLVLAPGDLLEVVGPSGAGKTTLGGVLVGLQRPDRGELVVEGRVLQDADVDWWRHCVAWAPQRPFVVRDTVAANIALGRATAAPSAIEAAARAAGAHDFIRALPGGYGAILGGRGQGLSPGQRQRIGLARALLRSPSLLVVDEPTAHLDPDSVQTVRRALEARRGDCTIVLITHELELQGLGDQRLRLDDGHAVVQEGRATCAS